VRHGLGYSLVLVFDSQVTRISILKRQSGQLVAGCGVVVRNFGCAWSPLVLAPSGVICFPRRSRWVEGRSYPEIVDVASFTDSFDCFAVKYLLNN